jgi:hypothetical protein
LAQYWAATAAQPGCLLLCILQQHQGLKRVNMVAIFTRVIMVAVFTLVGPVGCHLHALLTRATGISTFY